MGLLDEGLVDYVAFLQIQIRRSGIQDKFALLVQKVNIRGERAVRQ
jgi:hypothetical protein